MCLCGTAFDSVCSEGAGHSGGGGRSALRLLAAGACRRDREPPLSEWRCRVGAHLTSFIHRFAALHCHIADPVPLTPGEARLLRLTLHGSGRAFDQCGVHTLEGVYVDHRVESAIDETCDDGNDTACGADVEVGSLCPKFILGNLRAVPDCNARREELGQQDRLRLRALCEQIAHWHHIASTSHKELTAEHQQRRSAPQCAVRR